MRKTKIICTLGPATDKDDVLEQLILSGMNVARFNFSHGSHEEQLERFNKLKELRDKHDLPVAALMDTKGPEIRLGLFEKGSIRLMQGQSFTLTTKDRLGDETGASISFADLPHDVVAGNRILIDDGLIEMVVRETTETDIVCEVINEGVVSDRKGINVPGVELSMEFISAKDQSDILFAVKHGFDFIALSFTRTADDVLKVRDILDTQAGPRIRIIAKIENLQGVQNIDEILKVADGIMVARGDMGVEMPGEEVPVIQKVLIKKVYETGKQVITATQMLDSMMKNPRPTRAETADVANAIYDGTSAIMLSGETAAGKYPVEALQTMIRIAERTEQDIDYEKRFRERFKTMDTNITLAISHATCMVAHDLNAKAIITVTTSGRTAFMISRFRPASPIMGCSPNEHVCRQMSLAWGITPVYLKEEKDDTFQLFDKAMKRIVEVGHLKDGDVAVLTAGLPLGISGTTNMIKVQMVGESGL